MNELLEQLAKWHEGQARLCVTEGLTGVADRHLATAAALRELIAARRVIEYHLDPSNEDVGEYDTTTCATDSLLTQAFPEDKR